MLLAVSGGPDSTALALAFSAFAKAAGLRLGIATIDHRLRPESGLEVRAVEALAHRLGLPFFARVVNVPSGKGTEAEGRRVRYRALSEVAIAEGFDWIATGHTADDQAETVLFRLSRGAGLRGQRGILERRSTVLRPMLGVTRASVEAFLLAAGVEACHDASNDDQRFARNRVRREVVPALVRALGPHSVSALARSATVAAEDEALLDRMARRLYRRSVRSEGLGLVADRARLASAPRPLARRVLAQMAQALGAQRPGPALLAAALSLLQRDGTRGWPGGLRVQASGDALVVRRAIDRARFEVAVDGPGRVEAAGLAMVLEATTWRDGLGGLCVPRAVSLPLLIRPVRPGDRMTPLGRRGPRKVKDVLIDHGVPRGDRSGILAVCDGRGAILGLYGVRPAEAARCSDDEACWRVSISALSAGTSWTLEVSQTREGRPLGPGGGTVERLAR